MSKTIELELMNEFAEYVPFRLEPYGIVANQTIFSNRKITNHVIEWISKSNITKDVAATITAGLNNKRIIVGYTSKNAIKLFIEKHSVSFR